MIKPAGTAARGSARLRLVSTVIGLALTLSPTIVKAAAAPGHQAAVDDPAEALIQRGVKLRKGGDDAGARAEFKQAYALGHTARAAAQLGLAEQAIGQWDDAYQHLAESLRAQGDPWIEANRSVLEKSLAIVKGHVATVEVSGEPQGAEVYVNGRLIGSLPLQEPLPVMAGVAEIDVELRAPGYESAARQFTMRPNEFRAVVIRLEKAAAPPAVDGRRPLVPSSRSSIAAGPAIGPGSPVAPPAQSRDAPPAGGGNAVTVSARSSPIVTRTAVGWALTGVGAAAAVTGLIVAVAGQSKMDDAISSAERANASANASLYMTASAKYSDGSSERTTGRVLLACGVVATLAGAAIVFIGTRRPEPTAARNIGPWFASNGGSRLAGGAEWIVRW